MNLRSWRVPIAARLYVPSLVAFVLVSWAIEAIVAAAGSMWRAAGDTGIETEQEALVMLLAEAADAPWTLDELAAWHQRIHPQQQFALYDAAGELLVASEGAGLPPPDPTGTAWGDRRVVVDADGTEFTRAVDRSGRTYYGVTRYEPAPAQRRVESAAWWASLAAMAVGYLALTGWLTTSIVRPIRRLAGVARQLASGRLDARVGLARADEIGDLANDFDQMSDRLQRMITSQQVLMAQVSHELRTPMARLRVALDLGDTADDPARLRRLLAGMGEDLRELEVLVADTLAVSRLDVAHARGEGGVGDAPFDADALLASVAARFRDLRPDRTLLRVGEPIGTSRGDASLLARALTNLLDNADRHAPHGTPVTLRAGREVDGTLAWTVEDEGPGVAEALLPRLTEPFFRTSGRTGEREGGFGLGLSLCQRVMTAHGGELRLTNRPAGGFSASMRFPAAHARP